MSHPADETEPQATINAPERHPGPDQNEVAQTLNMVLDKVSLIAEWIGRWSCAPADSVAAGWAPLILEHVRNMESDLKSTLARIKPPHNDSPSPNRVGAGISLQQMEKLLIMETLWANEGNRERTAAMLKIGSRTLYRKLNEYSIEYSRPLTASKRVGDGTGT